MLVLAGCGTFFGEPADETAGWSAQRLYSEAKSQLADGNYQQAIKLFETLEARYPFGRFAQQAQLEVAYAYFKDQEPAAAIVACERFIKLHPNHPNVDYAYYLKGLVLFNEDLGLFGGISQQDPTERDPKAARESFEALKELIVRFPESRYAPDATARVNYLLNALASHEVHVARYYYKRGAYVAAANRAQSALRSFPEAPAIEEALYILVRAYDALGMTELRADAERIMRQNFPNSTYYVHGLDKPQPWWKIF